MPQQPPCRKSKRDRSLLWRRFMHTPKIQANYSHKSGVRCVGVLYAAKPMACFAMLPFLRLQHKASRRRSSRLNVGDAKCRAGLHRSKMVSWRCRRSTKIDVHICENYSRLKSQRGRLLIRSSGTKLQVHHTSKLRLRIWFNIRRTRQ